MEFKHQSVLLFECMDALNIKPDGIYVDGTLGGGGHSAAAGATVDGDMAFTKKAVLDAIRQVREKAN